LLQLESRLPGGLRRRTTALVKSTGVGTVIDQEDKVEAKGVIVAAKIVYGSKWFQEEMMENRKTQSWCRSIQICTSAKQLVQDNTHTRPFKLPQTEALCGYDDRTEGDIWGRLLRSETLCLRLLEVEY